MSMSNENLELTISLVYGGTTKFSMEDSHAKYFENTDTDNNTYEYKIVYDDGSGRVEYREDGTEDWYVADADEKYLEKEWRNRK